MLWELRSDSAVGTKVLSALSTPRMNTKPFERGYTTHNWDIPSGCEPKTNVYDTGLSAPTFADYLDALRCNGVSAASVDKVTDPSTNYPYPSGAPLCQ
jgi:hypothetical protein